MCSKLFGIFSFYYMLCRLNLLLHLVGELGKRFWMSLIQLQYQGHIEVGSLGMDVQAKGKDPQNPGDCVLKDVLLAMHSIFSQR